SGLLDSALAIGRRRGGPFLAEIEYRAGVLWWERYEQRSHGYFFKEDASTFDAQQGMSDWNYLETFLTRFSKPTPDDPGGTERKEAELHLRAGLQANPRHVASAGLLAVLMCNERRWEEAVALGR